MPRVLEPPFPDPVRDASVAGVVLAAGRSTRFGAANKLLADYDGRPLVTHAVDTLRASTVDTVTVVTTHDGVRELAAVRDAATVEPPANRGQAASLETGVVAVRDDHDAVLVALGDMPAVAVDTVDALVAAYRADRADAVAASYNGQRGNPVLFDGRYFDALRSVDGDRGGRDVFRAADRAALVATDDPGVRYDVDRPRDCSDVDRPRDS